MFCKSEKKIIEAIKEIGKELIILKNNYSIDNKPDGSPVTSLDLYVDERLKKIVTKLYPRSCIISEETSNKSLVYEDDDFFLIDPIDGTKEFISNRFDYTINLCRLKNKVPFFSVVYCPEIDELYYAKMGIGSFLNGKTLKGSNNHNYLKIVASNSHSSKNFSNKLAKFLGLKIIKNERMGSSLKICRIAKGDFNLYPRYHPTMEWDIAAAHLILSEAGGSIRTQKDLTELTYLKSDLKNENFIASIGLDDKLLRKVASFKPHDI